MKIKGIDVSKYQGRIDWRAAAGDGVEFAMIRAGYGMYPSQKDPLFDQNLRAAREAGVHPGAYHYSYAKTAQEAAREAETFLGFLDGRPLDYPAAFDLEDDSQAGLPPEVLGDIAQAFCSRVAAAGYTPMVYANKYWLQNKLPYERIKQWEIWLAHYAPATDYDKPHGIWQCSSRAAVAGVNGNCDLDWCYKDYAAARPSGPAAQPCRGVCTANGVYVHFLPVAGNNAVLRKLNAGNETTVFARQGGWWIVRAGEHYGYVSSDYLRVEGSCPGFAPAVCTADRVRVRSQPDVSDDANILRLLDRGNQVDLLEARGDWLAVRAGEHVGYAWAAYFSEQP